MGEPPSGLVDSSLLEKIDRLFACGAGDYVDLPQLVVVGHQSSGKSSVLEGLTNLPFPRDSGLCTRFATQIIFRRSQTSQISVSIIPAKDASSEHQEKMKAWSKQGIDNLNTVTFASIMSEVIKVMGISDPEGANHQQQAFSNDVLVLEVSGPSQEHFSVIDVPGIFRVTTQGLTTKDDIAMVDNMVKGYMSNPRSVMLAVVPCNVDIATQEIIELAEDVDPEGDRTIGVLTKPDLVDKGTEYTIVELIEDQRHRLKLGWHLLRNPGKKELDSSQSRSALELSFFETESPWNGLEKDKVGIEALRNRLQEILASHIRREFPKVKAEFHQKLRGVEKKLADLGPRRETRTEHAQYLMDISVRFQELATRATNADYGLEKFLNLRKENHLATAAVNRGETFAETMAKSGHAFEFNDSQSQGSIQELDLDNLSFENDKQILARLYPNLTDVEDLIHQTEAVSKPGSHNILAWLKSIYHDSRGYEIGTFAPTLLKITMQHQARKWHDLALGYISDIVVLVHSFVVNLLNYLVPSNHVRDNLHSLLIGDLRRKYQNAMEHTKFLLRVELEGLPATYNHYFNDTLHKSRQERLKEQLSDKSIDGCKHGNVVRLDDIVKAHPLSNVDHVVREVHDILRSYYKLARKRFVDCVRMQVADQFLVTSEETPLKLFSPKMVTALTNEQLENIAGEELSSKRRRAEFEKAKRLIEDGIHILQ